MLRLAGLLSDRLGGAQAFFCNSGAEANEAALKVARKATGRTGIVALEGGFHGRTLGALSATGQPAKWEGFGPLVPGMTFARPNDVESLEAAVTPGGDLAAIFARARARRGRRRPARGGLRPRGRRDRARGRRPSLRRRGPDRARPDRDVLRVRAARDRARSRDARQGPRQRTPDRRAARPRRASPARSVRATTGRPSVATRSPARPRAPSSRRSTRRSSPTSSPAATSSPRASPELAGVREVRGRGLLLAAVLDRDARRGRRRLPRAGSARPHRREPTCSGSCPRS